MPRIGRPPLPIGSHGEISIEHVGDAKYRARTRFRDRDGETRQVARYGQTRTEAKHRLRNALADRSAEAIDGVAASSTVRTLATEWLSEVDASTKAVRTKDTYRQAVDRYVIPELGALRLSEARTPTINGALGRIGDRHGLGAAKIARSVLTSMFGRAVRDGAITTNPVREVSSIPRARKLADSLSASQVAELTTALASDARARYLDVVDLVRFGLATGCRIGEAAAIRGTVLDDDACTVEINATCIRITGQGLVIQERPKTAAGWRVLALPPPAVDMLRARREDPLRFRPDAVTLLDADGKLRQAQDWVAFAAPFARSLRDPSNTAADLRETFDRICCSACDGRGWHPKVKADGAKPPALWVDTDTGHVWGEPCDATPPFGKWVTFHTLRRTVATLLDTAGMSPREIADQLGHAQPSMTQDKYMGRRVVSAKAAEILAR